MITKEQQRRQEWEQIISNPDLLTVIWEATSESHGDTFPIPVWHGTEHPAGVTVRAIDHGPGTISQGMRGGRPAPNSPLVVQAEGGEVAHGSQPWHAYTITCQCQTRLNPIAARDLLAKWVKTISRHEPIRNLRIALA